MSAPITHCQKTHKNDHDHSQCCHGHGPNPSVHQTLDELDFERGIWNAALAGDDDEVRRKLTQGQDVNTADKSGFTALHYASRSGHLNVCKTLLGHGAEVNAMTFSSRATPLQRAAYMGHMKVVTLLLDSGADALLVDCDGMTALHKAAEKGHVDTLRVLLSVGPTASRVRDNKGRTPGDLCTTSDLQQLLSESSTETPPPT